MNRRVVLNTTGYILIAEAALMLFPALISLIYSDGCFFAFIASAIICAVAGFLLLSIKLESKVIYAREGFAIVAISWILMSIFGSLPYIFSGEIPNFVDAFFETVSGFSTTGATILADIETCCRSVLFWRSFTQWIGGMGVLVFVLVIVPLGGERSMNLVRAEVPGPTKGKLVPKMRNTARLLYMIYIGMTLILMALLCSGGMDLFDSVLTAFGTAGTGGFLNYTNSIAHFNSPYFEYVISIFMLLFGINFNLYYLLFVRQWRQVLKNEELRWYIGMVLFAVITITLNLAAGAESYLEAFRVAFFQVSSVMTTTCFTSANLSTIPEYSRALLITLMFVGACTSSTGGGLKVSRIIIWVRSCKQGVSRMLHPRAVTRVQLDGKPLEEGLLRNTSVFLIAYVLIATVSVLLLSLDNLSFHSSFSVVLSCLSNGGAATQLMGIPHSYVIYSDLAKFVMCFDMLAGRLEIFPMLIVFAPSIWKISKR